MILPLLDFCSRIPRKHPQTTQERKEILWRTMIADTWICHPAPLETADFFQEFAKFLIARALYEGAVAAALGTENDALLRSLKGVASDLIPLEDEVMESLEGLKILREVEFDRGPAP